MTKQIGAPEAVGNGRPRGGLRRRRPALRTMEQRAGHYGPA
ncbi:hypothetical protein [Streptomyces sp. NPDC001507]